MRRKYSVSCTKRKNITEACRRDLKLSQGEIVDIVLGDGTKIGEAMGNVCDRDGISVNFDHNIHWKYGVWL